MGMISMKVHQLARGLWSEAHEVPSSLTLGCKRLRPLAPKLVPNDSPAASETTSSSTATATNSLAPFDLKTFIRPGCGPHNLASLDHINKHSSPSLNSNPNPNQGESGTTTTHPGGTRWNPTQEQIGILEALYRGGMRTPNAQQIEQITSQLGKFGKIEGKNVFYWFQNHKARERQKQKRNSLGLAHSPRTPTPLITTNIALDSRGDVLMERDREDSTSPYKRKCRSWGFECLVEDNYNYIDSSNNRFYNYRDYNHDHNDHLLGDGTLELFPLRPEGR